MKRIRFLALLGFFLYGMAAAQPYTIGICNSPSPLPDSCGGSGYIPNGSVVSLWLDRGAIGVDASDSLVQTTVVNEHGVNGLEGLFCFEFTHSMQSGLWTYIFADNCDTDSRFRVDSLHLPGGVSINIDLLQAGWDCTPCQPSVVEEPVANATSFILHANYPNPFNASTEIRFDLPRAMQTNLKVYDILGREVAELAGGVMNAGSHSIIYDASGLSSGVYFYRLEAGEFGETRKMVLLK